MSENSISRIIAAYDDAIIRTYALLRFQIIRQRFLDEIGQYLPAEGRVIDVGCGFGLFSLYYALNNASLRFSALDYNANRIEKARSAAKKLGIANVDYTVGDARTLTLSDKFDAAYMLDIIHHVPPDAVIPLLRTIYSHLDDNGILIIKDVADKPAYKRWFTWLLDKLMDYHTPVHYWPPADLITTLRQVGFRVYVHSMVDILPYPHMLYICYKSKVDPKIKDE